MVRQLSTATAPKSVRHGWTRAQALPLCGAQRASSTQVFFLAVPVSSLRACPRHALRALANSNLFWTPASKRVFGDPLFTQVLLAVLLGACSGAGQPSDSRGLDSERELHQPINLYVAGIPLHVVVSPRSDALEIGMEQVPAPALRFQRSVSPA